MPEPPWSPRLTGFFERLRAATDAESAQSLCRELDDLGPEPGESPASVAVLLGMAADLDVRLGNASAAEATLRRALPLAEQDPLGARSQGFVATQLATLVTAGGSTDEAIGLMSTAAQRARVDGLEPRFVAMLLGDVGQRQHTAGRYVQAEATLTEAVRLASLEGDPVSGSAQLLLRQNLAVLRGMTGAWAGAFEELGVVADLAAESGDRVAEAGAVVQRAVLARERGLPGAMAAGEAARRLVLESAESAESVGTASVARTEAAVILRSLAQSTGLVPPEEAVDLLGRAVVLAGPDDDLSAGLLADRGEHLLDLGRFDEAEEDFAAADRLIQVAPGTLSTREARSGRTRRSALLRARALSARLRGEPERSLELARSALRLMDATGAADDLGCQSELQDLALAEAAAGDLDAAVATLARVVAVEDRAATEALELGSDQDDLHYVQFLRHTMNVAVSLAFGSANARQAAFELLLARKGLAVAAGAGTVPTERPTRAAVAARLAPGSVLVDLVRYRRQWLTRYDGSDPGRDLRTNTGRYAAFVLTAGRDEPELVDLGPAAEVERAVDRQVGSHEVASRRVGPPDAVDRAAADTARLRALVLDPWADRLVGCDTLVVCPDGELARVSFAALPDDAGGCLADRITVSYLAAGRDLLRDAESSRSTSPLVVADPDFGTPDADGDAVAPFARLPGTRREAEGVARLLGVRPLLGRDATRSAVLGATSPRVLHIATHGFFLAAAEQDGVGTAFASRGALEHPLLRCGLALAGANLLAGATSHGTSDGAADDAADGILTGLDLAAMNLSGTELVTLSACDSALGDRQPGEGMLGLARAAFLAGAECMVMSLWEVPDQVTADLMTALYGHLTGGLAPPDALRAAQLDIRRTTAHPSSWGGFVCIVGRQRV